MLKHHLLLPHTNQHHFADFRHYLSLGAHTAPYHLHSLTALSLVTLKPKQQLFLPEHLPNDTAHAVLLLRGSFKVDSV